MQLPPQQPATGTPLSQPPSAPDVGSFVNLIFRVFDGRLRLGLVSRWDDQMENEKKRSREWESPLSPSTEIDESHLSLEEKRRLNIERNRRFFEQLNFPMGGPQQDKPPLSPAPALTEKTNPKAVLEERLKRLKGLMDAMPHRKEQIESIWQYVSSSVSLPACAICYNGHSLY